MARSTDRPNRKAGPIAAASHQRHGRIVSHAPGRVRIRLQREHRDATALAQIAQNLGAQAGVTAVATNARTGSVLLAFDHYHVSHADVAAMLYDAGIVARDLLDAEEIPEDLGQDEPNHSATATGLMDALGDLDARLARLTGGRIDLKLAVPLGLALLAARQISTVGLGLGQMPGYILLWYAFDAFHKLHQRQKVAVPVVSSGSVVLTPAPR